MQKTALQQALAQQQAQQQAMPAHQHLGANGGCDELHDGMWWSRWCWWQWWQWQ